MSPDAPGGLERILGGVEYEFFEFEACTEDTVELRRQIRLHFVDGPTVYVAWTWERQHGPLDLAYSIAFSDTSYFTDLPDRVVDLSRPLI